MQSKNTTIEVTPAVPAVTEQRVTLTLTAREASLLKSLACAGPAVAAAAVAHDTRHRGAEPTASKAEVRNLLSAISTCVCAPYVFFVED